MTAPSKSVLFVCLGNICRSPTGEAVLLSVLEELELSDVIQVDSAGTIGHHAGNPADARMMETARRRGFDLQSRSRKIIYSDLETFDVVIAMDRENLADIKHIHPAPAADIKLLSDYLDDSWPSDVPDPYYGGAAGFEYVLDMIEAACPRIVSELAGEKPCL
jgi:protein-tyrosine phosphatase